jgi:hypothetical protein
MKEVIFNYLRTTIYVALDFFIAWLLAVRLIARKYPQLASKRIKLFLFLIGTGALLIAGIGRLGWAIQTFDGNTPPERWDQTIFLVLSLGGTFLLVLDLFMGPH